MVRHDWLIGESASSAEIRSIVFPPPERTVSPHDHEIERTELILRDDDMFYIMGLMTTPSLGTLELAALLAVARLGEDAYGLAVRRDLIERTRRNHSTGAVYTTLQRLEDKGLLASHSSAPLPVRGGRSRRQFTVTGAGMRAIRAAERQAAALWAGMGDLSPRPA